MTDVTRTPAVGVTRVRLSLRSALALVFGLALTILLLEMAADAQRVIAWILCAAAVAALVYPAIEWLAHFRFIPRGLAVLITVFVMLGAIGFIGYRIVDDVTDAMTALQDAAPSRAADLERDSDFFREIRLEERVTSLVDTIPERLAGGEAPEAIRSAASRGVAFLAGVILTIFFVLYGKRLYDGAVGLVEDPEARRRTDSVVRTGSRHALFFTRVKIWEAVVEGLLAYGIARAAGVPGPAALGVWFGLWSIVPVAGIVIGALPVVIFAGSHTMSRALVVTLCFVAIGIADMLINRWLHRRAVDPGSFLIVLAGFGGLELYGLAGALLFILAVIFALAIIGELGPEEVAEVLAVQPGDDEPKLIIPGQEDDESKLIIPGQE
jgi:predicted PurR-regulated permease PerM